MTIIPTELPEVLLIQTNPYKDERGWFMESFHRDLLGDAFGNTINFCQENKSFSNKNVF
mgnify:CR=1 FL=1